MTGGTPGTPMETSTQWHLQGTLPSLVLRLHGRLSQRSQHVTGALRGRRPGQGGDIGQWRNQLEMLREVLG